ncbi:hypothetical protein EST38_g8714 [Candolleomyces aberdarensis]|uniref:Protein kinase domain-containing protein n=1 Tax=Candolleomyces aberdarensis TaxID=2316362 RepID=A0A4Q2DCK4_9AGAR|nr:hypothetical protein EST38_g8714 [Candolleomyces aberdarensis]
MESRKRHETSLDSLPTYVGDAIGDEVLCCRLQDFQAHYLPTTLRDIDHSSCFEAGVKAAKSLLKYGLPDGLMTLVEVCKAICPEIGTNGHGLSLRTVSKEQRSGSTNESNFSIDGYFTETVAGGLHVTDVVVPLLFTHERSYRAVRQNRFRVVSAVSRIMDDLRRMFTFAITIENDKMTLWYFSRSHSMKSQAFDYVKVFTCNSTPLDHSSHSLGVSSAYQDPDALVSILVSLMYGTTEEVGLDPRITLLAPEAAGDRPSFVYQLDCAEGSRFYMPTHTISEHRACGIYGRFTRVFRVQEVENGIRGWEPKPNVKPMVLKDVWANQASRPEKEIQVELFKDIQAFAEDPEWRSSKCLAFFQRQELEPIIESFEALLHDEKYKDLFLVAKQDSVGPSSKTVVDGAWVPKDRLFYGRNKRYRDQPYSTSQFSTMMPGGFNRLYGEEAGTRELDLKVWAPKYRYFVLFDDECTTIDDLPNVGTVFSVLGQCMSALLLMFCAGWVHRDISPGNIMALEDLESGQWSVKLADFEYAKKFPYDKGKRSGKQDPLTGTPCFMAHEILAGCYLGYTGPVVPDVDCLERLTEILSGRTIKNRDLGEPFEPVTHNFQHDVEAIFWIVLWVITLRVGYKPSADYAQPAFQRSMTLSDYRTRMFLNNSSEGLRECLLAPLKSLTTTIWVIRGVLCCEAYRRGKDQSWFQPESYSQIHAIVGLALHNQLKYPSDWAKVPLRNSSESGVAQFLSDIVPKPMGPPAIDPGSDSEQSSELAQPRASSKPSKSRKRTGTVDDDGEEDCGLEARRKRRKSSDEGSKLDSPKPGLRENSRYGLRPTVKAPRR